MRMVANTSRIAQMAACSKSQSTIKKLTGLFGNYICYKKSLIC